MLSSILSLPRYRDTLNLLTAQYLRSTGYFCLGYTCHDMMMFVNVTGLLMRDGKHNDALMKSLTYKRPLKGSLLLLFRRGIR